MPCVVKQKAKRHSNRKCSLHVGCVNTFGSGAAVEEWPREKKLLKG
jgi:hypothetical protein